MLLRERRPSEVLYLPDEQEKTMSRVDMIRENLFKVLWIRLMGFLFYRRSMSTKEWELESRIDSLSSTLEQTQNEIVARDRELRSLQDDLQIERSKNQVLSVSYELLNQEFSKHMERVKAETASFALQRATIESRG